MSLDEAREAGERVAQDCAWVVATRQALEDECRRTAEECDRVHAAPLQSPEDALRRAAAIAAMAQAREERDGFLADLSKHDKRGPPLRKLRERYERGDIKSHRRFRDRDLAIAARAAQEGLAAIGAPSRADRSKPPLEMILLACAIRDARRTMKGEPRGLLLGGIPEEVLDEIFDLLNDPEVIQAWVGPPASDERPGPSRASNVLTGLLMGVSWTLVRDARKAVEKPAVR